MTGDPHGLRPSATSPLCVPGDDGTCSLCGDVAVRAHVIEVGEEGSARVRWEGGEGVVATDLVDAVAVGDVLLVHQGFAIGKLEAT